MCKCVCCSSFVKSIHAGNHLWGVGKFSCDCVSKQPLLRLYDYRRFERNSLEDERHSWLLLLHYRLTVILNYVCKIRISKCQEGAQWIEVISKGLFHKGVFQSCYYWHYWCIPGQRFLGVLISEKIVRNMYIGLYSDFWPHVGWMGNNENFVNSS